jgi:hypothetical protein
MINDEVIKRTENVVFSWTIKDIEQMKDSVRQFKGNISLDHAEELCWNYTFSVGYLGNIVENFEYLIKLMESGQEIKVDMKNLNDSQILCQRFFEAYHKLVEKKNEK